MFDEIPELPEIDLDFDFKVPGFEDIDIGELVDSAISRMDAQLTEKDEEALGLVTPGFFKRLREERESRKAWPGAEKHHGLKSEPLIEHKAQPQPQSNRHEPMTDEEEKALIKRLKKTLRDGERKLKELGISLDD